LEKEEIVTFGNDHVLDSNGEIVSSELNVGGVVVKLLMNHLLESQVGSHDDEGVVDLTGDGPLVGEIEGRTVEELEDGVVGVGG
jgi:hypothetical protein